MANLAKESGKLYLRVLLWQYDMNFQKLIIHALALKFILNQMNCELDNYSVNEIIKNNILLGVICVLKGAIVVWFVRRVLLSVSLLYSHVQRKKQSQKT